MDVRDIISETAEINFSFAKGYMTVAIEQAGIHRTYKIRFRVKNPWDDRHDIITLDEDIARGIYIRKRKGKFCRVIIMPYLAFVGPDLAYEELNRFGFNNQVMILQFTDMVYPIHMPSTITTETKEGHQLIDTGIVASSVGCMDGKLSDPYIWIEHEVQPAYKRTNDPIRKKYGILTQSGYYINRTLVKDAVMLNDELPKDIDFYLLKYIHDYTVSHVANHLVQANISITEVNREYSIFYDMHNHSEESYNFAKLLQRQFGGKCIMPIFQQEALNVVNYVRLRKGDYVYGITGAMYIDTYKHTHVLDSPARGFKSMLIEEGEDVDMGEYFAIKYCMHHRWYKERGYLTDKLKALRNKLLNIGDE